MINRRKQKPVPIRSHFSINLEQVPGLPIPRVEGIEPVHHATVV